MRQHSASQMPSLDEICAAAGWWFEREPTWTRRHTVTVKLESDRDAHLRVDIEVELPREEGAAFAWNGHQRMYIVPLVPITKDLRPAQFEVLDEHGGIAHTFTRVENTRISVAALEHSTRELLEGQIDLSTLLWLVRRLTSEVGREREFYLAWAEEELEQLDAAAVDGEAYENLLELIVQHYSGTMLWVPLAGMPGTRRTVRINLHQKIEPAEILRYLWTRLRPPRTTVVAKAERTEREQLHEVARDFNSRGLLRRIWNRLADTLGFAPFQLRIPDPFMRRTASYHLQVESPPGVDVRVIRPLSRIEWPPGSHEAPRKAVASNRGHFYFSGATGFNNPVGVLVNFRVGQNGPLFLSALSSSLIATMLWFFAANAQSAAGKPEVSGPTLLLVPTLLIVFVARPGEHALMTRLLSGVRFLLLVCGVTSAAAAAAIAGVFPFGAPDKQMWQNVGYNWHYEAVAVTVVASVLMVSWLLAFSFLETWRANLRRACSNPTRYGVLASLLFVAQLALVLLAPKHAEALALGTGLLAALLLGVAVVSCWIAAYGEVTTRRGSSLMLALASPLSLVAAPVYLGLNLGLTHWSTYHRILEVWLLLLLLTAFPFQFVPESSA